MQEFCKNCCLLSFAPKWLHCPHLPVAFIENALQTFTYVRCQARLSSGSACGILCSTSKPFIVYFIWLFHKTLPGRHTLVGQQYCTLEITMFEKPAILSCQPPCIT